jgi:hypothetical protein
MMQVIEGVWMQKLADESSNKISMHAEFSMMVNV